VAGVTDDPTRADGPVLVTLPESLARRMRFGPFPSVRHALKFAAYAAVGALAATVAGPIWWLPFLGGGFLLSVHRSDGKGFDERVGDYVAYRLRAGARPSGPAAAPRRGRPHATSVETGSGQLLAVLAAGGVPVAFLPPADARRLFEGFRGVLDRSDGRMYLVAGLEPLRDGPFLPKSEPVPGAAPDSLARRGYREMIEALCRRRARRRVWVVLWTAGRTEPDANRLDRIARGVGEGLEGLGIRVERLRDRELAMAAGGLGWIRSFGS